MFALSRMKINKEIDEINETPCKITEAVDTLFMRRNLDQQSQAWFQ